MSQAQSPRILAINDMSYTTEVVVVGAGVVGMSAALAFKDRGMNVICIEQGVPGSGQSKGVVRNFRHYHANMNLIQYAMSARGAWKDWEDRFGRLLLKEVGLISLNEENHRMAQVLRQCKVPVTLNIQGGTVGGLPTDSRWDVPILIDERAGPIWVTEAIEALNSTLSNEILCATVLALHTCRDHVEVATTEGVVQADQVLVCAGTQTDRIALSAGIRIEVTRAVHSRPCYRIKDEFKGSDLRSLVDASGLYGSSIYGAPTPDGLGYVVGLSGAGDDTPVQADSEYSVDLAAVNSDIRQINGYVEAALSGLEPHPASTRLCTTTALPGQDGDAITCLKRDRLSFMIGNNLFKFAPLLGQDLAKIVAGDESSWLMSPI
jgi:sarcosine oxidase